MESNENQNAPVWGALALTLRISRWFGIAPLRFVQRREGLAITGSITMTVYSYTLLFVMNAMLITAMITDFKVPSSRSVRVRTEISIIMSVIDYGLVSLITSIGILNAPGRIKRMIPYLNSVNQIITKLNNNACTPHLPEKRRCIIITWYLLWSFLLFFIDYCVNAYDATVSDEEVKVAYMYGSFYIESFINVLLQLQFISITIFAHKSLKMINEGLVRLIQSMDSKTLPNLKKVIRLYKEDADIISSIPSDTTDVLTDSITLIDQGHYYPEFLSSAQKKKAQESIRHLVFAYSATCDIMKQVDKFHGILLLLILISILVQMVVTPYYFICYLINSTVNFKKILLQLWWCSYLASKLALIVEPGHRMKKQMARTRRLVGQLTNRVTSPHDPLSTELDILFRQIQLNKVEYSPLGMCVLTRPLIATIIGGVTTYLVLAVQFQAMQ